MKRNISVMIKPVSGSCDLNCAYCFYRDETASREVPLRGKMSRGTAVNIIKSAAELSEGGSISIVFQGGEPTLAGREFYRNFMEDLRQYAPGVKTFVGLQTNGMTIDDEWAALLRDNGILVGLSLDGDREADSLRTGKDGSESFDRALSAAHRLINAGAQVNILTVLTTACAARPRELWQFYRSNGFRFVQFIPCLRPLKGAADDSIYMTPAIYADFLITEFNYYVKDFRRGRYISERGFDNLVRMYYGGTNEQCGMSGHCSYQFVAEADGTIYPCDFYCTDGYELGNINSASLREMAGSDKAKEFITASLSVPERCRACRYYGLCRAGGCRRQRESADYCESYKKFFSACLPLFEIFRGHI